MNDVAPLLALPAKVCATLVSLGDSPGGAAGAPLKVCLESLERLGGEIRSLLADFDTFSGSCHEQAKKLLATLAGVEAAARIVQQEDSRR
jgi:hypothetical protein